MAQWRVLLALPLALLVTAPLCLAPRASVAQSADHLLISEVLYDAPQSGLDSSYEWVEVFNPTSTPVDLAGWTVGDSAGQDSIPAFTLQPGCYLVIAATEAGFFANHPGFGGNLVALGNPIGAGLGNTGDRVILADGNGIAADAMSYGTDAGILNPACPGVPAGQSLERAPSGHDTDTAADWLAQEAPNPGGPGGAPIPTPTPTQALTASATATDTATAEPSRTASPSRTSTETTGAAISSPTATGTPTPSPSPTATTTPSIAQAGDVVVNEVMQNPKAVADAYGEWYETQYTTGIGVERTVGRRQRDLLQARSAAP